MIDNPDVIQFSNTQLRPFCDFMAKSFYSASHMIDLFTAKGIVDIVNKSAADFVGDGSPGDGRTAITGQDILNILNVAQLVSKVFADNGDDSIKNQVLKVAVNP